MSYGHTMETTETGARCSRCLRTAAQIDRSRRWCPGVPWYIMGRAPDHLYTRLQLRERGLRPGKDQARAGIVVTAFHDVVSLYDIAGTRPRRGETEKQRAARLAGWKKTQEKWRCQHCDRIPSSIGALTNYWRKPGLCESCKERLAWEAEEDRMLARMERDHQEACEWAADLFTHPETSAIVDTETSSLTGIVLEIGVLTLDGTVLFHSLVNPDGVTISNSARAIHGLTDEELAAAPLLPDIWPHLVEALQGRATLIAYNAAFDRERMEQSATRYDLSLLQQQWECAMEAYSAYCGDWSEYHGGYRWIPLGGGHRALDDCRAALVRLREMAGADMLQSSTTGGYLQEEPRT